MREYENDFYAEDYERYYSPSYSATEREEETKTPRQYSITRKGIALIAALCILISGMFGAGGALIASKALNIGAAPYILQSARTPQLDIDLTAAAGSKLSTQQIIDLNANAVVEINTEYVRNDIWMRQFVTPGAGSGVIISPDGYIMTNNHVINGSGKITVILKDGATYEAKLIGADNQSDVAVIKIEATGLTPVVFGDSDTITMGDPVVAIGNPLGQLGGTATAGIISSLDRQLTIDNLTMNLLQTDASINRGNSGGGLFNEYGEMIGLVVAKSEGLGVEGLGFAIPINTAKTVAMQLLENGYVKGRPQIGIQMIDLTSAQDAVFHGVRNLGVYVQTVLSDNAKRAGIKEGDMLYYIEDVRINKPSDLTDELQKYKVGDTVKLTVVRDNEIIDISVVLSEQKQ